MLIQTYIICMRLHSDVENSPAGHILCVRKRANPTVFYTLRLNGPLAIALFSSQSELSKLP